MRETPASDPQAQSCRQLQLRINTFHKSKESKNVHLKTPESALGAGVTLVERKAPRLKEKRCFLSRPSLPTMVALPAEQRPLTSTVTSETYCSSREERDR